MTRSKLTLVLCVLANVAASFPIFIIGGSFIFAEGNWGYFAAASMAYAVLSCVLLYFTLINPTIEVLIIDRISNLSITVFAFMAFTIKQMYEPSSLFTIGATAVLLAKWTTHTYVYKRRTSQGLVV